MSGTSSASRRMAFWSSVVGWSYLALGGVNLVSLPWTGLSFWNFIGLVGALLVGGREWRLAGRLHKTGEMVWAHQLMYNQCLATVYLALMAVAPLFLDVTAKVEEFRRQFPELYATLEDMCEVAQTTVTQTVQQGVRLTAIVGLLAVFGFQSTVLWFYYRQVRKMAATAAGRET